MTIFGALSVLFLKKKNTTDVSMQYDSRYTGHRKIILGICRHTPGTYHTSRIYQYLRVARRETVRNVLDL